MNCNVRLIPFSESLTTWDQMSSLRNSCIRGKWLCMTCSNNKVWNLILVKKNALNQDAYLNGCVLKREITVIRQNNVAYKSCTNVPPPGKKNNANLPLCLICKFYPVTKDKFPMTYIGRLPCGGVGDSVYVWQSFCKFFSFDMQELAPKKMHVNWHTPFRSSHYYDFLMGKNTCQLPH